MARRLVPAGSNVREEGRNGRQRFPWDTDLGPLVLTAGRPPGLAFGGRGRRGRPGPGSLAPAASRGRPTPPRPSRGRRRSTARSPRTASTRPPGVCCWSPRHAPAELPPLCKGRGETQSQRPFCFFFCCFFSILAKFVVCGLCLFVVILFAGFCVTLCSFAPQKKLLNLVVPPTQWGNTAQGRGEIPGTAGRGN